MFYFPLMHDNDKYINSFSLLIYLINKSNKLQLVTQKQVISN